MASRAVSLGLILIIILVIFLLGGFSGRFGGYGYGHGGIGIVGVIPDHPCRIATYGSALICQSLRGNYFVWRMLVK
jgi:hypothetical protein